MSQQPVDGSMFRTEVDYVENQISSWREFCEVPKEIKKKCDDMQHVFTVEHKLVEKLLEERKDYLEKNKDLAAKYEKLKQQAEKQKMELVQLQMEQRKRAYRVSGTHKSKPKPKVQVCFYNPQHDQTIPVNDITSRIEDTLLVRSIKLVSVVTEAPPESDLTRPVLLLCVNVSRLGTDVSNALRGIHAGRNVAVIVLHHKDIHVLPKLSSEKSLTGPEFQSLGLIVDMAFWKGKGLHQCEINRTAVSRLADFLSGYIRS